MRKKKKSTDDALKSRSSIILCLIKFKLPPSLPPPYLAMWSQFLTNTKMHLQNARCNICISWLTSVCHILYNALLCWNAGTKKTPKYTAFDSGNYAKKKLDSLWRVDNKIPSQSM